VFGLRAGALERVVAVRLDLECHGPFDPAAASRAARRFSAAPACFAARAIRSQLHCRPPQGKMLAMAKARRMDT
jgi:hypothetical protein